MIASGRGGFSTHATASTTKSLSWLQGIANDAEATATSAVAIAGDAGNGSLESSSPVVIALLWTTARKPLRLQVLLTNVLHVCTGNEMLCFSAFALCGGFVPHISRPQKSVRLCV